MSKIANAFKNGKAFIGFVTGGDPSLTKTEEFVLKMAQSGADLIEIGVPFSDPIAEGPVIQRANLRALAAGTTMNKIFETVAKIREKTEVPLVLLTYLNPVFHYGYADFFERCQQVGVDGVIIPDLPYEERAEVKSRSGEVDIISLIAPTSDARIAQIAQNASGFLYIVSSLGVTGVRSEIKTDIKELFAAVRRETGLPAAVGFGIHTPEQAGEIARIADGVIVGSAIVKLIEEYGETAGPHIEEYVREMKAAIG
ncbi:MAG: tryptophan synthase subunit alpha [Oscillospiraceae bacterium]|jgi:tryptophan synthase alpha chain|nr:tryptophan synthase subunit alpha [Oscillospiraceae bacterium]